VKFVHHHYLRNLLFKYDFNNPIQLIFSMILDSTKSSTSAYTSAIGSLSYIYITSNYLYLSSKVLRERPPPVPPRAPSKIVEKLLPALPQEERRVVIERFAPCPPKPSDVIIERWLPYKQSGQPRILLERAPAPSMYVLNI
jgi:hypothetical protein